ncbi:carboxypeptidase-like regulatory domain-containing protein [Flavobacterium psychrotrophum]|uniref:carboxypeptidase-like regulatory domain-containing protein n=1 Tax=Flavobacterium psychrotrophum TaxID=2294119 RepID=UPI000E31DF29|nr:carboxypeptidase-like regulatory domain-containing protein [Flavobacterium psychrotrophum]
MSNRIQISIPTPCHEKWADMTPTDKGRFCASCQKQVFDFTNSTDREISIALKNGAACGRFKESQLDRDLIIPKEKNTMWIAASAAVVSFFTLGSEVVKAQAPVTEINPEKSNKLIDIIEDGLENMKGIVTDDMDYPIHMAYVTNTRTMENVKCDFNGNFTIKYAKNDVIEIKHQGYKTYSFIAKSSNQNLQLESETSENIEYDVYGTIQRSFFGRIFHRIGNIFR